MKNAFQSTAADAINGTVFVAKFDPNGALVYSTYLGGSNYEDFSNGYDGAIAVDSSGSAYVVGSTASTDFPVKNAYQGTRLGNTNAFLTKFAPSGSSLVFSTYLGGKSSDGAFGVAVDSTGAAYVTGTASSTNFPTTAGALATTCAACANFSSEAFETKFKPDGSGLLYSTFLGDSGGSSATGIAVDSSLSAYISGNTTSKTFPVVGTLQQTCIGCVDSQNSGFISKLNPAGSALVYSEYIGGHGQTFAMGVGVDTGGLAFVAGSTDAPDFPSVQPAQAQGGLGIDSSTDSGTTIVKNNQGLASAQINAIVADPSNPGTVYAATLNGVFKSLDSGVTWTAMNSGLPAGPNGKPVANIQSIAVQPGSGKVLAGVLSKGVYASTNGGTTWTASSAGFPSPFSGSVGALAFDQTTTSTVYVGIGNGITLLKSVNSGANWTRSDTGLPVGDNFFVSKGIIVDPRNSSNVYFSATEAFGTSKGLYASTDGAATWHAINTGLPTLTVNTIVMDPAVSSTLYAGTSQSFSPDGGVFKTVDSGAHWTLSLDAGSGFGVNSLAIDPVTGRVYAGIGAFGMVYSTDAGATWNSSNLTFATVSAIAIEQGSTPTQLFGLSPVTGRIGGSTSFLTNLSADGSSLVYSTYAGGPLYNQAVGVAIDPSDPYLATNEASPNPFNIANLLPDLTKTNQAGVVGIGAQVPADLAVAKKVVADRDPITPGATLTYLITITNNGPGPAHDVMAIDTMAASSPFDFTSINVNAYPEFSLSGAAHIHNNGTPYPQVECLSKTLVPVLRQGESITCRFTIKTNDVGICQDQVVASSDSSDLDPNLSNNTASLSTPVVPGPTVTPTATPNSVNATVAVGATVAQILVFTNVASNASLYMSMAGFTGSSNVTLSNIFDSCAGVVPGQQCTVGIGITGNTVGPFSGSMSFPTNSVGSPVTIAYGGNVVAATNGAADLQTTASIGQYSYGERIHLQFRDVGPSAAFGPVVTLAGGPGVTFPQIAGCSGVPTGLGTPLVVCPGPPTLRTSGLDELVGDVSLASGLTSGQVTATVSSALSPDPNFGNNSVTVTFTPAPQPPQTVFVVGSNSVVANVTGGTSFGTVVGPPGVASGVVGDSLGNVYVAQPTAFVAYDSGGILTSTTPIPGTGSGPGNYVATIGEDGDGKFYLGETNGNVSVVNNGVVISPANGLNVGVSSPVAGGIDSAGHLWFVGANGDLINVFGSGAGPAGTPVVSGDFNGTSGFRP